MPLNKDLQSIQEARDLVEKAKEAQLAFRKATQEQAGKVLTGDIVCIAIN